MEETKRCNLQLSMFSLIFSNKQKCKGFRLILQGRNLASKEKKSAHLAHKVNPIPKSHQALKSPIMRQKKA